VPVASDMFIGGNTTWTPQPGQNPPGYNGYIGVFMPPSIINSQAHKPSVLA
jgi:hypothetical protein